MSVTNEHFKNKALTFLEVTEAPHFEKLSFRVGKKIFATLNTNENKATLKLTEIQQSVFCANPKFLTPVPNKWGKQGWTIVHLDEIPEEMCWDALQKSYDLVAKNK